MFSTEREFVQSVAEQLEELALEYYLEVPCLSRCIDLIILERGVTTAIEFKLKDWRRGLSQAREHLLAVDTSIVCLPWRRTTDEMMQAFSSSGVGLSLFPGDGPWAFKEVVSPSRSKEKWGIAEAWLEEALTARRST